MNDIEKLCQIFADAKVLYVEDEETVRTMSLPLYTKIFGLVDTASDGEEGLKLFEKNIYDIVITDLRMPKMNGREMLTKILELNPNVITVILTASESNITVSKDLADIYLSKPFGLPEFLDSLQSIQDKYNKIRESRA